MEKNLKTPLSIVKIGGNIIDSQKDLQDFINLFSKIKEPKILVHGGGKSATKLAKSMGIEAQMVDGRRITDANMLNIVVMTYAGDINKNIVAKLQGEAVNAMGFSGADGNLILSSKRNHPSIDYGFVGDVQKVNTNLIEQLINIGVVPVFCAITHDGKGKLLNTNADTVASELAIALSEKFCVTLHYCFEKSGVLMDSEDNLSVIEKINTGLFLKLKDEKAIHSGMIPKLENCFNSLSKGVYKIKIGHHSMFEDKKSICTTIEL